MPAPVPLPTLAWLIASAMWRRMRYSNGDREHVPSPETEAAEKTQSIGAEPHLGWAAGFNRSAQSDGSGLDRELTGLASTLGTSGRRGRRPSASRARRSSAVAALPRARTLPRRPLSAQCDLPQSGRAGGWRNGAHMTRRELSLPRFIALPLPLERRGNGLACGLALDLKFLGRRSYVMTRTDSPIGTRT